MGGRLALPSVDSNGAAGDDGGTLNNLTGGADKSPTLCEFSESLKRHLPPEEILPESKEPPL